MRTNLIVTARSRASLAAPPAAASLLALAPALALVGCGSDDNPSRVDAAPGPDTGSPVDAADFGDPLVGIGTVTMVRDGFMFTEGPQWREEAGDLVFTDIPESTVWRYVPGGTPTPLRMPSNNANGLAVDGVGALYAAEHGSRAVSKDGTAIASMFEGYLLNSPNDVIVADDGTVYFTDPPFGLAGRPRELDFMGVFRLAPGGALTAEHQGALTERPNGIGLSPDGKTLYVADTADGNLYKFPIESTGALGARTVHAMTAGNPDGLAIDSNGNIFVTTRSGVEVFSATGARWGLITVPMQPANCAFGDPDHRTLYITARTTVFQVRLAHAGLPRR